MLESGVFSREIRAVVEAVVVHARSPAGLLRVSAISFEHSSRAGGEQSSSDVAFVLFQSWSGAEERSPARITCSEFQCYSVGRGTTAAVSRRAEFRRALVDDVSLLAMWNVVVAHRVFHGPCAGDTDRVAFRTASCGSVIVFAQYSGNGRRIATCTIHRRHTNQVVFVFIIVAWISVTEQPVAAFLHGREARGREPIPLWRSLQQSARWRTARRNMHRSDLSHRNPDAIFVQRPDRQPLENIHRHTVSVNAWHPGASRRSGIGCWWILSGDIRTCWSDRAFGIVFRCRALFLLRPAHH